MNKLCAIKHDLKNKDAASDMSAICPSQEQCWINHGGGKSITESTKPERTSLTATEHPKEPETRCWTRKVEMFRPLAIRRTKYVDGTTHIKRALNYRHDPVSGAEVLWVELMPRQLVVKRFLGRCRRSAASATLPCDPVRFADQAALVIVQTRRK